MAARLNVRVTPNAAQDAIKSISADLIEIRLRAPAVEGRANEALIRLLADRLGIRPRDVSIVQGATARRKVVAVEGLEIAEVLRRLPG